MMQDMVETMDKRSTVSLLAAAAILSAILGFCYGATFNGACDMLKDAPFGCAEWMLSRYQTLIAAAGAIFAAWLGSQPVLKQLKLARLQTSAILQQVYTTRENSLESGFKQELAAIIKLKSELSSYRADPDDEGHQDFDAWKEWAWAVSQDVDKLRALLSLHQFRFRDGDEMKNARKQVIAELGTLSKCMSDFNATQYGDDPELGFDDEDRQRLAKTERQAEWDLQDRVDKAIQALDGMRKAYATDLRAIRVKRAEHDLSLAKAAVLEELDA